MNITLSKKRGSLSQFLGIDDKRSMEICADCAALCTSFLAEVALMATMGKLEEEISIADFMEHAFPKAKTTTDAEVILYTLLLTEEWRDLTKADEAIDSLLAKKQGKGN